MVKMFTKIKIVISILLMCVFCKAQTFIVLTTYQRDSLINILLPNFQTYMNNSPVGKIELAPIMLADSSHYILPTDLLLKPEWKPLKDAFTNAGYIQKLIIRQVSDSEFVKPKNPF